MNSLQVYLVTLVAALIVLYPQDAANLSAYLGLQARLHVLNLVMLCKAWLMYRALSRDLAKLGVAPPPFRFVPLWERN